jgi:hypothetical protein
MKKKKKKKGEKTAIGGRVNKSDEIESQVWSLVDEQIKEVAAVRHGDLREART